MATMPAIEIHLLIEAVKKRPELWDNTDPDLKRNNKEKWIEALVELGLIQQDEEPDDMVVAIKAKWKNLRDCYVKHKRAVHTSGPLPLHMKQYKRYRWSHLLVFLDESLGDIKKLCNNGNVKEYEEVMVRMKREDITEVDERESDHIHDISGLEEDTFEDTSHNEELVDRSSLERRKKTSERTAEENMKHSKPDSIDLMFQSYAETMKTLSAPRRAQLKIKMAQMFATAELEELQGHEQEDTDTADETPSKRAR